MTKRMEGQDSGKASVRTCLIQALQDEQGLVRAWWESGWVLVVPGALLGKGLGMVLNDRN